MSVRIALRSTPIRRTGLSATLVFALGFPMTTRGQQPVAIGPYVQNVGTSNAVICWATLSGEVTVSPPVKNDTCFREYQMHSIVLRGLTPGTTYTYRVPGDTAAAGGCTFTTLPEGEHAFSFCVISDTQNRDNKAHRSIVEHLLADRPDILFNVGDLVSDGRNTGDWEEFFRTQGPLLRSVPCYPVLGNHERDASLYFQFFTLPGRERYYSFNRGAAHFVVLDSPGERMPDDNQAVTKADQDRFKERSRRYWQQQMQWFKDDLAGHRNVKYVFVFLHFPIYSLMASRVASTNEFRDRLGTVFQDDGVTAVFSGHDHHYHREVVGGVHFVDGGVGGGSARPINAPLFPETVKHAAVESFTRVDIGLDRANVRVIDVTGHTVDEFELSPRPQSATKPE